MLAELVPELHREPFRIELAAEGSGALGQRRARVASCGDAAEIALDVGSEHRHAGRAEFLGKVLEGGGFAGSGAARDQPVPVRLCQWQRGQFAGFGLSDFNRRGRDARHSEILALGFSGRGVGWAFVSWRLSLTAIRVYNGA